MRAAAVTGPEGAHGCECQWRPACHQEPAPTPLPPAPTPRVTKGHTAREGERLFWFFRGWLRSLGSRVTSQMVIQPYNHRWHYSGCWVTRLLLAAGNSAGLESHYQPCFLFVMASGAASTAHGLIAFTCMFDYLGSHMLLRPLPLSSMPPISFHYLGFIYLS